MSMLSYLIILLVQVSINPYLYDALFIKEVFLTCIIILLVYKSLKPLSVLSSTGVVYVLYLWGHYFYVTGFAAPSSSLVTETFFLLFIVSGGGLTTGDRELKRLHYFMRFISMLVIVTGFIIEKKFGSNAAVFGNKNFYAAFLLFMFPFWVFSPRSSLNIKNILVSLAGSFVIIFKLFSLSTRSALVSLVLLNVFLLLRTHKYKKIILSIWIIIGASFFVYPKTTAYLKNMFNTHQTTTIQFRIHTWRAVLDAVRDKKTGWGMGNFKKIYPVYRPAWVIKFENAHQSETAHAHSEYLETFMETGIIGFGIWLWWILTALKLFDVKSKNEKKYLPYYYGLIGLCIVMLFSVASRYLPVRFLFYLPMAAINRNENRVKHKNHLVGGCCIFVFILIFSIYIKLSAAQNHLKNAVNLSQHKKFSAAKPMYEKTLELNSLYKPARYFYGNLLYDIRRYKKSLENYKKLKMVAPHYVQRDYRMYLCNKKLKKIGRSYKYLRKSLLLDPLWEVGWEELGWIHIRRNEWNYALRDFKTAYKILPEKNNLLNNIGNIHFKLSEWDKALYYYQKLLKKDPSQADAYNNIGNVYYQMGLNNKARENYEMALKLNPGHSSAKTNYNILLKKIHKNP